MNEDIDVVEVRRQGRVALVVALAALAVAVAFVWRGGVAGYLVGALMLLVAAAQGWAAYDSRLPLLLLDEQGVRLRFGQTWRGFPWSAVESVEHTPRPQGWQRFWKDGRIGVLLRDEEAAVQDLTSSARRQAMLTERLYGVPFAVPLGLSTRVLGAGGDLTHTIAALAGDDVEVAEIDPTMAEETGVPEDVPPHVPAPSTGRDTGHVSGTPTNDEQSRGDDQPAAETTSTRPASEDEQVALTGSGGDTNPRLTRVDDSADEAADDQDDDHSDDLGDEKATDEAEPEEKPARAAAAALREDSTAVRADVRYTPSPQEQEAADAAAKEAHDPDLAVEGATALRLDRADDELPPRPDLPELPDGVRRISKPGKPVEALSFDGVTPRPADEPVIGPEIAAARTRLGLSVDALAEWTRIRPHVIEAIEVDDFAPCGGDFYARGHLRTLARVLAIEVAPLLEAYDEKYASGPVSPRTVFSAELGRADSKPLSGRRGSGGPTWSVLVAAVMAVVLVWSVARLIIEGTEQPKNDAAIQLDGSAGTSNPYRNSKPKTAPPVKVTVTAAGGGAHVIVRDARGKVVFTGDLAFGQSKSLQVAPPLRVQTSDGSLTVSVDGGKAQPLGKTGAAAQRTYTSR